MATEKLNISGWDSGWPTGFVTNVDEPIASADGQTVSTTIENDTVVFDLDNVTDIADIDTVTAVEITVRGSVASALVDSKFSVELLIGGVSQGADPFVTNLSSSMSNQTYTAVGWNSDWTQAELNGAQVKVTAQQTTPGSQTWYIDCIDVDITYTALDPIVPEPGAGTLALAGQAPTLVQTQDFAAPRPPVGTAVLAGKVPVIDTGVMTYTNLQTLTGKPAFVNSLTERLQINGWDSGWPTGFVSNVDEPTAIADGQVVSTSINNDVVIFDLDDVSSNIVDLDNVLSITMVARGRSEYDLLSEGPGSATVELLVNGSSKGFAFLNLTSTMLNFSLANSAWNEDWTVAELNSMQVKVTAQCPGSADVRIDTIDVVVEYANQSPFLLTSPAATPTLDTHTPTAIVNELTRPAAETVALSGQVYEYFRTELAQPAQALLRIGKKTPTVLRNSQREPAAATPTLAGKAPLRVVDEAKQPAVETLSFSGEVPTADTTLNHFRFPPRARLLAEMGDVVMNRTGAITYILAPRVRAHLLGIAPTPDISLNTLATPAYGSVNLTGAAPTLGDGTGRAPAALALSLAPSAPSPVQSAVLDSPGIDTLALTGHEPSLVFNYLKLALTGYEPVLAWTATPGATTLMLAGEAVIVEAGSALVPEGILDLTGHTPARVISSSLTPGQPKIESLSTKYDVEFIATPTDILID